MNAQCYDETSGVMLSEENGQLAHGLGHFTESEEKSGYLE